MMSSKLLPYSLCFYGRCAGWADGAQTVDEVVSGELPMLVDTYKGIHAHPELSHHEEHTATLLAGELRKAGFAVTEHVGKYPMGASPLEWWPFCKMARCRSC